MSFTFRNRRQQKRIVPLFTILYLLEMYNQLAQQQPFEVYPYLLEGVFDYLLDNMLTGYFRLTSAKLTTIVK